MILDDIAAKTRIRIVQDKQKHPLSELKPLALAARTEHFTFEQTLRQPGISFICEVKKASPSKGIIAEHFPYVDIAMEYEAAGADCISVLTEPSFFLGRDEYLQQIRTNVSIPLLRKDFILDEYQIYQAKLLGADAVLLICSLLDDNTLSKYLDICDVLGLSALVEAHDKTEVSRAIHANARMIGVNNRNLKNFHVNVDTSRALRDMVPRDRVFIAESGIQTVQDMAVLYDMEADGVLIGETMMRAKDKKALLQQLRLK